MKNTTKESMGAGKVGSDLFYAPPPQMDQSSDLSIHAINQAFWEVPLVKKMQTLDLGRDPASKSEEGDT